MKVYIRENGSYEETEQYGGEILEFLYGKPAGRFLLKLAVSPIVSNTYAKLMSGPSSTKKIPEFIDKYNIDMSQFEKKDYRSFRDFFVRRFAKNARVVDRDKNAFISPADAKLLVYEIGSDLKMNIKGSEYTMKELLGKKVDNFGLRGGYALVFRLCMDDCHRYCFVDDGTVADHYKIKGKLHTVSSISKDYKIFKENTREVSFLKTEHFGELIQVEVGALLVGRIKNSYTKIFYRGDEKGYFEPGGSTIIILVQDAMINIDEDILQQSRFGIETQVKYGERIGKKQCLGD